MKDLVRQTTCPICGSGDRKQLIRFDRYAVNLCKTCSLVYLDPRLSKSRIRELYSRDYYTSGNALEKGYEDYLGQQDDMTNTYRRLYRKITPFLQNYDSVLDIGCGYGAFLSFLKETFRLTWGIDTSIEACEKIRSQGLTARYGDFEDMPIQDFPRFSLILFTDLIEHIYDVRSFAVKVSRLSRPGTIVALTTPDYNSVLRHLMGRNWVSYKIPEHVNYFTVRTIKQLFSPLGYEMVYSGSAGQYATPVFTAKRLSRVSGFLGTCLLKSARLLSMEHSSLYFPNGNMLAVLKFRGQRKN
ncbi:MAG: class I SAM-dependent methyltransferase [Kiritimatiellia bacterium]